jgi:phosphoribosylglycinamide formyltransferase 2
MDREGIRKLASEKLSIPTSPYGFARNLEELTDIILNKVGFPCFIKPTMSSSGKGQSKIFKESEIDAAWKYAALEGRVDKGVVIAEGMVAFDYEITLLTVRAKNGKDEIETHFCEPIGHRQENGDYVESWQPQPMTKQALKKSREIAIKITNALGGLGIFGVELFIKGDEVWFSEVSPRPHDTGMVTMITQRQSEFELHAKAILGFPVNTALLSPGASNVIYGQHDAKGIIFEGIDKALSIDGVDVRIFGKPESFKKRRMGVVLAEADSISDALAKVKKAQSLIQIKVK